MSSLPSGLALIRNEPTHESLATARSLPSPLGDIEFKRGGEGVPVLVIHGSGGGFDQGELIATAILDEQFDWIAPSRFGYLRSTFHKGATFDDQAEAYAHLFNHLGLHKVVVLAHISRWSIGAFVRGMVAGAGIFTDASRLRSCVIV